MELAAKVEALLKSGHRNVLGFPDQTYWDVLRDHFDHTRLNRTDDCIGVQLYGDEATIFDGLSYMCIAWSSENSPFATFSSCSRFLICLLPVPLYLMSLVPNDRKRKINETLQAAIGCIVESLDSWSSSPVCGLRGEFVALKGDWKWLTQVLCLRHHAGTNQVCWQCPASKSIDFAYTDLSSGAAWRQSRHDPSEVHFRKPSIAELGHFNMKKVSIDWMHCFHLGVARDVVASTLVVMLRTQGVFVGAKVSLS